MMQRAAVQLLVLAALSAFVCMNSAFASSTHGGQPEGGADASSAAAVAPRGKQQNVLFIVVDDLRVDLGPYNIKGLNISTPNLDKLAARSLLFERAYVQQAVCGPSRNSFMSGRRPDVTKTWNFKDNFREGGGKEWVAFPQHFKQSGCLGKLYHPNSPPNNDEPKSWSPEYSYFNPNAQIQYCNNNPTKGIHNITCNCEGLECTDAKISSTAVQRLHELTQPNQTKPWFLGVGFHKPHPDWGIPRAFYDAIDVDAISMPAHPTAPTGMPDEAFYSCSYLSEHSDYDGHQILPTGGLPDELVRKTRHAYYAAVEFMDAMVGQVLDALEASGQADNTVISFHSDHGWQLGEHGIMCKQTNFELATRIPWMIYDPQSPHSHGERSSELVEIVDLYRTVSDLAGAPAPESGVQGQSLAPLFAAQDPNTAGLNLTYAFSQYPRCGPQPRDKHGAPWSNPCTQTERGQFKTFGYTVRSDEWRYTEWRTWDGSKLKADWSDSASVSRELYAHSGDDGTDLDAFENANVADDPANAGVVSLLSAALRSQFADDS